MKILAAIILLFALPAFSAPKHEVIPNAVVGLSVSGLSCVTPGGTGSQAYTNLDGSGSGLMLLNSKAVELKHRRAYQNGCLQNELNSIVDKSAQFYGFDYDIHVEVTKDISDPRKDDQGKCFASYTEKLKIDLGGGVVLASEEGEFRSMNDCK